MKLNRKTALKIHFILDQCLPPFLRDFFFFMRIPMKFFYKDKAPIFFEFKKKAMSMSKEEFRNAYAEVASVLFERETDLTTESILEIEKNICGRSVLEVGCGGGLLSGRMSANHLVTACDIIIDDASRLLYPDVHFQVGDIEKLDFPDKSFDTVVCAHTLEHVQNISVAIRELRRVAKTRLIVVVPKQRPYKYTFDLHLHFFPYQHSLLAIMGTDSKNAICKEVAGDLVYIEDVPPCIATSENEA